MYVKETHSHQYLHPLSRHSYHCVRSIPCSQDLRLNGICLNNIFYGNRCNQLSQRNYKQKLVREQFLKARAVSRETLLNNERNPWVEDRLVLNLTYHPLLRDFQKALNEAQIPLTPNEEHKTVFEEKSPMIGWCNARILKGYLVGAKITKRDTEVSKVMVNIIKFVSICDVLRDLVPSAQFKNREKHPWRSVNFSKVAG